MEMDVIWRQLCVSMILGRVFICPELGKGATSEGEGGSSSSDLLMCGGDVRSILLLPLWLDA